MEKSECFPIEETTYLEDLASVFDYRVGSLPSTYLGLPVGAPHKSTREGDSVIKYTVMYVDILHVSFHHSEGVELKTSAYPKELPLRWKGSGFANALCHSHWRRLLNSKFVVGGQGGKVKEPPFPQTAL
ncbi:hypothetical protein CK203_034828 [Vitis vinifera]|uniref:Uncharacterized protein n=1 Tax=Vitis vinifera TaxID=29760 RepID=A0A438IC09_VITVI|nr:hypothetical protein CK203_034828 [Vitis vinifera]